MPANIIREAVFNDGQGLDFNDLNNISRYLKSFATDCVLGGQMRRVFTFLDPSLTPLYCLPGAGSIQYTGSGLAVTNARGLILQKTGIIDGTDSKLLACELAPDDLATTMAAADPTHPRWDLIELALAQAADATVSRDFKDATTGVITSQSMSIVRRVAITKTVKQGTPATTPVRPTVDAGNVPWAYVYIPAAATTLNPIDAGVMTGDLDDQTMPLGFKALIVPGRDGIPGPTFDSDYTQNWPFQRASVATTNNSDIWFFPKALDMFTSRLLGIRISGIIDANTAIEIMRINQQAGSALILDNITSSFSALVGVHGCVRYTRPFDGTVNAWWGTGYASGVGITEPAANLPLIGVRIRHTSTSAWSMQVDSVTFEFAGIS